ncbi:hypothetical protein PINS_up000014 [Pythium insidiosum]|nr:hypothetical protein PINS_up000014 [Pythium insidiosum]
MCQTGGFVSGFLNLAENITSGSGENTFFCLFLTDKNYMGGRHARPHSVSRFTSSQTGEKMAQQGGDPFQYGHGGAPQFHNPHQRQRPAYQQPSPQSFNYGPQGAQAAAASGQYHSQPAARPYPGMSYGQPHSQPQQQPMRHPQPMSAPVQQPPQQFYSNQHANRSVEQPKPGFGFNPKQSFNHPEQPATGVPPQARPQAPHDTGSQPDFINQLSQNPMAGLAMNTAQDFLTKQSAIYLPGAYGIWGNTKYYFTVNNSYVKSRLKILLFPFWHRDWRRLGQQDSAEGKSYAPPTRDVNAPDLYLPLMGFLTYILIAGYTKGASNQFSPDVIGNDASYCLVMQLIEIGILAACLYLLNSSISFLDLVSFSGYKYIALVINTVVYQLAGSLAYYVALLYTGVAVSYFTLNCMKGSVAEPAPENRAFRNYMLFGVSCLQLVLVCWISYTTSPRE